MGKYCCSSNCRSKRSDSLPLPVETTFKLPSPLPPWPEGEGFGSGTIDLGGLQVRQVSTFTKVWATYEGGPDNLGASFFEPSQIPRDFFMLGCYTQPNNRKLRGWVLVARDKTSTDALKKPIDYTLVWSSESLNIRQDGIGYFWSPTPPKGYKAVGHIVTNSQEKPSLEKVRCVRSDLTDECKTESWIWGPGKRSAPKHFNVFSLAPKDVGMLHLAVCVGTFLAQKPGQTIEAASISMACMKNINKDGNFSWMPNLDQIQALFQAYAPWIYLHPNEKYFPSSVSWFFVNGALLYKKGDESKPEHIEASGYNLPRVNDFYDDDGAYWIDLPVDVESKERIKKGNLKESEVYLHVKPIFGRTFTDVTLWIFYPFNGPAKAKVCCINIPCRRIGEHVGDWEHLTLRVSNFSGELWSVYCSQHSRGHWVDAQDLEFQDGNKPAIYSSLHGHAMYSKPGLVLQGCGGIGNRNDTAKSEMVMDTGARFSVVAAEYLNLSEPPWLNYRRKWGPKISYGKIMKSVMKCFPSGMSGEEGPTGPMLKKSWKGDEVVK